MAVAAVVVAQQPPREAKGEPRRPRRPGGGPAHAARRRTWSGRPRPAPDLEGHRRRRQPRGRHDLVRRVPRHGDLVPGRRRRQGAHLARRRNVAYANNDGCADCEADAFAYQFVLAFDGNARITGRPPAAGPDRRRPRSPGAVGRFRGRDPGRRRRVRGEVVGVLVGAAGPAGRPQGHHQEARSDVGGAAYGRARLLSRRPLGAPWLWPRPARPRPGQAWPVRAFFRPRAGRPGPGGFR